MYPRPRSRRTNIAYPDLPKLKEQVAHAAFVYGTPLAVVVGTREWQLARRLVAYRTMVQHWPGGEETFDGVPVIVRRHLGQPRVLVTQDEVDEALLEKRR